MFQNNALRRKCFAVNPSRGKWAGAFFFRFHAELQDRVPCSLPASAILNLLLACICRYTNQPCCSANYRVSRCNQLALRKTEWRIAFKRRVSVNDFLTTSLKVSTLKNAMPCGKWAPVVFYLRKGVLSSFAVHAQRKHFHLPRTQDFSSYEQMCA